MGGGPKKEDTSLERETARSQIALGNRLADQSQAQIEKNSTYQAPLVNFLQGIINGDMASKLRTASIPISQIATGNQQARENILDTQPAGAARDFALAGLKRDQVAQTSGFLNDAYLKSFPMLAQIGAGDAGIGLQQLGGGLRSTEAGVAGIGNINNRAAQQKSSTMGLIGSIAGGVASAATGGLIRPRPNNAAGSGVNVNYATNNLGNGSYGAGPVAPPSSFGGGTTPNYSMIPW